MVGLAVIVGLVFGVASIAFGNDGQSFIIGQLNTAESTSTLDKSGVGPALRLKVDSGAPLAVNSANREAKLNADKVDGHDAPLWAVVNSNGTLVRGVSVTQTSRIDTGDYRVTFNRDVSGCAYAATLAGALEGEISTFVRDIDPNATTPQQQ
jgi:hypothetical protein